MTGENNLYLKLLKFAISMILMCIWMHRMRKGSNFSLKNTNYLLKSFIFNIKYTSYKTNLPF